VIIIRIGTEEYREVIKEVSRAISLSRLMEGGTAMFAEINRNHAKDREGSKFISPLFKNSLRVLVDSYIILTLANSPEEEIP